VQILELPEPPGVTNPSRGREVPHRLVTLTCTPVIGPHDLYPGHGPTPIRVLAGLSDDGSPSNSSGVRYPKELRERVARLDLWKHNGALSHKCLAPALDSPRVAGYGASTLTPDQVEQAIIGLGGAIIGAVGGGLFVVYAVRAQWKRDRTEGSRQAARRVLAALVPLEGVFATLLADHRVGIADAATAFNTFSTAATTELPFITDDQARSRVSAHVELCHFLISVAATSPPPRPVLEAVRRHADAITEALDAHIRGTPLPRYTRIPTNSLGVPDVAALIAWPGQSK
jgi:hypothetical protein